MKQLAALSLCFCLVLNGWAQSLPSQFVTGETVGQAEAHTLFDDTFFNFDTANKWTCTNAGGGVAAQVVGGSGQLTLGSGTTANGYSYCTSQGTFLQSAPGFLVIQNAVNLEFPVLLNAYRFWGFCNPQAVPTATNPIADGIGIEVGTNGRMAAVTFAAGTRNLILDLSSTGIPLIPGQPTAQPKDSSTHKYRNYYRGDLAYWFLDPDQGAASAVPASNVLPIAQMLTGGPGPLQNNLPACLVDVAAATAPTSSAVLSDNHAWVGDTTGSSVAIRDPQYPWRTFTVCNKTAVLSALGAATTQIVGIPANGTPTNSVIKVCSAMLANTNATPTNIKFVEGTGTNCATAQTSVTGNIGLAASPSNVPVSLPNNGPWQTNVAGDALCATGSAAGAVDITITYFQGLP